MMLIFLDIDGVMVPAKSWATPELLSDGFPAFSAKTIAALQSIISDSTAIVLTTSHKERYSLNEWKQIFSRRGINVNKIRSLEGKINELNRKDELARWFLNNHLKDTFVIIDDDKSLNDLPQYLKSHLVLTNSMIGLTEDHVSEIRNIQRNNHGLA